MSYLELRIFWIYSIRMAKLTITILMLICGTVHASIGIIDGTQEYFHDMVEVVRGRAEVYGVLVKTSMDVELAIGMFIAMEVDVIAIPRPFWEHSLGVAWMVTVANRYGIPVIAAGSNQRHLTERLAVLMGAGLARYEGVEYMNSNFWRSASENNVRRAVERDHENTERGIR